MWSRSAASVCCQPFMCTPHVKVNCHGHFLIVLAWSTSLGPPPQRPGAKKRQPLAPAKKAPAVGAGTHATRWFGMHSAEQLINTVHRVEGPYRLHRADSALRLAVIVADQAIQGDGYVRFTLEESNGAAYPSSRWLKACASSMSQMASDQTPINCMEKRSCSIDC